MRSFESDSESLDIRTDDEETEESSESTLPHLRESRIIRFVRLDELVRPGLRDRLTAGGGVDIAVILRVCLNGELVFVFRRAKNGLASPEPN